MTKRDRGVFGIVAKPYDHTNCSIDACSSNCNKTYAQPLLVVCVSAA
jgi:hypothetical protein